MAHQKFSKNFMTHQYLPKIFHGLKKLSRPPLYILNEWYHMLGMTAKQGFYVKAGQSSDIFVFKFPIIKTLLVLQHNCCQTFETDIFHVLKDIRIFLKSFVFVK